MEMNILEFLMLLTFCLTCSGNCIGKTQTVMTFVDECHLEQEVIDDIASYFGVINRVIEHVTNGPLKGQTYDSLATFVDRFGARISGSQVLEDAIDYMVAESEKHHLENIHTENVKVPHWQRGFESATLLQPRIKHMAMLGLGLSVATPPGGITAEAIVVKSFQELQSLNRSDVAGKIVVYNQKFISYGKTVQYRSKGASEAAKLGAVAALVRSITPYSLNSPHTGMQSYQANVTKIPVAAITIEDAEMMGRMQKRNTKIVIKLVMSATYEEKISRNTIVELTGSERPEKVVMVSGHIDSWDVGQGAIDDGGGAFISWFAPIVLKDLNLRPKRTLRSILWTAEEFGYVGARAYNLEHESDDRNLVFVMESDIGTFEPLGLYFAGSKTAECMVKEILKLFVSLNATELKLDNEPGPDISFWTQKGIPSGGLYNANDKYFFYHHSEADTMTVLDRDVLDRNTAFWTAVAYVIADMKYDIPRD